MVALVIDAALIALGAGLAVFGGSPIVLGVFRLVGRRAQRRATKRPAPPAADPPHGLPAPGFPATGLSTTGQPATGLPATDPEAEPDASTDPLTAGSVGGAKGATQTPLADPDLLPGGEWIGYLERLAVFATLTAGWKEGLALILAIKGLARYPELALTDSRVAEKFIIGTLASVLFAAACAGITAWLTGLTR